MSVAKRTVKVVDADGNPVIDPKTGKPKLRVTGYTATVNVPNPTGKGRGTRYTIGTFRTQKAAERNEQRAQDEVDAGTFVPPHERQPKAAPLTVADAVATWFALKKREITANSAAGYQTAIDKHLIPALGDRPVADLTHDAIQNIVNGWQDEGKGAQTVARCILVLRSALARQVHQGVLPYNPASDIVKESPKKRRELTLWTPEQMRAFLAKAEADPLGPFWWLTLLEGFRRGEALGLRWSDLQWSADESTAVAFVRQTVVPDLGNGGKAMVQPRAKTKASERAVDLNPVTVRALKAHRDRQKFQRQQMGDLWQDHGLIITNPLGGPLNPSNVKAHRQRLIQAAGVPRLTTHDLRHVAATLMLAAGTSPALVSRKIGHSSIQTTVDTYGHISVSDQAAANAAVLAYLERQPTGTDGGQS
ncbi:MAG: site-specific integrase [Thermomicrobiales bacterium]